MKNVKCMLSCLFRKEFQKKKCNKKINYVCNKINKILI